MAASDHLNEHQWPRMPLDEVLKLPSIDAISNGWGRTVADAMPEAEGDLVDDKERYEPLRASMAAEGQKAPVHIFTAGRQAYGEKIPAEFRGQQMFGNGHHRVAIARQLGWHDIAYTPHKQKSATEEDT